MGHSRACAGSYVPTSVRPRGRHRAEAAKRIGRLRRDVLFRYINGGTASGVCLRCDGVATVGHVAYGPPQKQDRAFMTSSQRIAVAASASPARSYAYVVPLYRSMRWKW